MGLQEKGVLLALVLVAIVVTMVLVNLLFLGHQAGNVANNIVMTGGE